MNTKQVIVIRKDLKMRKGKEISQGSHSSIMWLIDLSKKLMLIIGVMPMLMLLSTIIPIIVTGCSNIRPLKFVSKLTQKKS